MPAFRVPSSAVAAALLLALAFASGASAQIELPPTPNTTQGGQDVSLALPAYPNASLPAESNATLPVGTIPASAPAYPGAEPPIAPLPLVAPGNETGPGAAEPPNATTPPVLITLPGATRKPLPDAPANFTTAYNGTGGLNATNATNATAIQGGVNATNVTAVGPPGNTTLLNLNATSGTKNASGVCFDRGFYHLSCYQLNTTSNTTVDDVIAAKTECLAAWAQTRASRGCNVSADLAGTNAFNCSHYFVYHFSALPCRTSYQNQERANTNCSLYQSLNLSAYRGDASLKSVDYRCGGTL